VEERELLPFYYKVKEELIRMIDTDEVKPDQLVPSERELINLFGVSRTTVRKAMDDLVNEGYLYKVQGKGTFVKRKRYTQGLIKLTSCTEEIRNQGLIPKIRMIENMVAVPKRNILKLLELGGEERALQMERLISGDDVPLSLTRSYLPLCRLPGLEMHDFSKESLYKVIESDFGISIIHANRTIEAVLADKRIASYMEIPPRSPVLFFTGLVFGKINGKEVPVEYFESYFRTDRIKFFIDQVR